MPAAIEAWWGRLLEGLFSPADRGVETRQEENDGLILMAALQQLTFACEEDTARVKAAHVECGRGANEGRFSAPVSTATIQKVTKLGVPKENALTGWAGNVRA